MERSPRLLTLRRMVSLSRWYPSMRRCTLASCPSSTVTDEKRFRCSRATVLTGPAVPLHQHHSTRNTPSVRKRGGVIL